MTLKIKYATPDQAKEFVENKDQTVIMATDKTGQVVLGNMIYEIKTEGDEAFMHITSLNAPRAKVARAMVRFLTDCAEATGKVKALVISSPIEEKTKYEKMGFKFGE